MGNCGTHVSATDGKEDTSSFREQLNQHDSELKTKNTVYGAYPEFYRQPMPLVATDPAFDCINDADTHSDIPSARSTTPGSCIRPKSYVKQLNALDSSSPVGCRGNNSITGDTQYIHEQRPGSASHVLRGGLSQSNYSHSANSSSSYGCNGNDHGPYPLFIHTQYRYTKPSEKQLYKVSMKSVQQRHLASHSIDKGQLSETGSGAKTGAHRPHFFSQDNLTKYFVAIFDYQAHCDEDITVHKGDVVALLDHSDVDWWLVENKKSSSHGYVPSAYLAEKDSIDVFEWYFREMSRKDSERLLLLQGNPLGTFLVRASETSRGALSLSVRDYEDSRGDVVKHYKMKHHLETNAVCITTKKVFTNLIDLITHYSSHADGLCCRLTKPCPRPPPILSDLSKRTKDYWEIDRCSLVLQEKLGAGQFGEVWRGEWNGTTPVAVKTLKPGTMTKEEFLKEARIMKTLSHAHLVRLFAVVTTEPIYIVTELMSNGSLLHVLRSDKGKLLELKNLVDLLAQIANGMAYLEAKGLVHRDLAARNILVGDNNIIKIADFGLTRAIDTMTEAYTAKQGTKFPIKWTAPEAACRGQFTIKSDVWSFGVVIYEVVTYGHQPFPSMNNTETLDHVNNGYRMPCPQCCPAPIYNVMLQTWDAEPERRPTFDLLCEFFEDYVVLSDNQAANDQNLQHSDPLAGRLLKRRPGYPYMNSPARFSPT